jgi:hypothetical protein
MPRNVARSGAVLPNRTIKQSNRPAKATERLTVCAASQPRHTPEGTMSQAREAALGVEPDELDRLAGIEFHFE